MLGITTTGGGGGQMMLLGQLLLTWSSTEHGYNVIIRNQTCKWLLTIIYTWKLLLWPTGLHVISPWAGCSTRLWGQHTPRWPVCRAQGEDCSEGISKKKRTHLMSGLQSPCTPFLQPEVYYVVSQKIQHKYTKIRYYLLEIKRSKWWASNQIKQSEAHIL